MSAKPNFHIWLAVAGFAVGFSLLTLNAAHHNDPTKLAILIFGALLCGLSPLAAFIWHLNREGRFHMSRSGMVGSILMVAGLLGPSRVDALAPLRLGDLFGLLFWTGFAMLGFVLFRYWCISRKRSQALYPRPRKDLA